MGIVQKDNKMKNISHWFLVFLFVSCSKDAVKNEPADELNDDEITTETNMIPCEAGFAGEYPCSNFDLLTHLSLTQLQATSGNDCWGWTDDATGKEYALMGLDNGTAFIDISDVENIRYLGKLPTATVASSWRDIKVYNNYAYIVSEAKDHGVQVFDLTQLRDVTNIPATFSATALYKGIGNAHNIVINTMSGFGYPVGTARDDLYNGGVHFLDLADAANPQAAGGWGNNGYTHDAQVVTYDGPDTDYTGAELFVGANEDKVVLLDITQKAAPKEIAVLSYPNTEYAHQGWFTEDFRYYILGDELDEVYDGFSSRTLVFDMTDLDNPVLHHTYLGPTNAIDHNGYVVGKEFYLANYTAGVRLLDISLLDEKIMTEIGYFDTFPSANNTDFNGVWSVYPYFKSGKIVVSDINSGLFIIQKSN